MNREGQYHQVVERSESLKFWGLMGFCLSFAVIFTFVVDTYGCRPSIEETDELPFSVRRFSFEGHSYMQFRPTYGIVHDANCKCQGVKTEASR